MTNSIRQRWRTLTSWQRTALSAATAMLVGWCMLLLPSTRPVSLPSAAPSDGPRPPRPPRPPSAPSAPPRAAQPAAPQQAPAQAVMPRVDPLAALRRGLASDNAGTRVEALRTAADQQLTEALPELLARDLAGNPESAPTLIQVTARLAQLAPPPQRTAALEQLTRWLHAQAARQADDARGNVSVLVETLASWNGQEVVPVLSGTLQDEHIPLHVQTLAVQGLNRLRASSARAALTTFRARIAQSPPRGGFELELQQEALQAADRALSRLH